MATDAPWTVIRAAADRLAERAGRFGIGTDGQAQLTELWIAGMPRAVAEPLVTWLRYTAELWEMQDWAEKPDSQTLAAATLEFAGAVLGEVQR